MLSPVLVESSRQGIHWTYPHLHKNWLETCPSWRQRDCWPKPRGEQASRALQLLSLTVGVLCCIVIIIALYCYLLHVWCTLLYWADPFTFTLCTLTLNCCVLYRMDPLTHVNCKLCTCFLSLIYCTKTWTWKRTIWSTLTTKIKFSN